MREIIDEWINFLLSDNYPIRVAEIDAFIRNCAEKIVEEIIELYKGKNPEKINEDFEDAMDDLMRFFASGKEKPRDALKRILILKDIFAKRDFDTDRINKIIDHIMCIASEYYALSKEHIYKLKLKEVKNENEMLKKVIEYAYEYYEGKKLQR